MADQSLTTATMPLLSLMLLTPVAGVLLIWLVPDPGKARRIALGSVLLGLVVTLMVVAGFDPSDGGFQLVERYDWIPTLNIQYLVGVDGISVLFLPLTVLLFVGVILASWTSVRRMQHLYFSLLLMLASATLGIFCALDTVLFFLFWELTLIPIYFLVSLWGVGPNRRYAAVKYTLFMLAGGVPLLFAFLVLAFNHAAQTGTGIPAGLSFDYPSLLRTPLPHTLEMWVFLLLLLGFAVKTPLFPLHTWLPVVATDGPVNVAALMTGLKLGVYGLIRFAVPLAPGAAIELHWLLAGLGVIGILYGALAAVAQTNLRRMLAFSSVSHVGLVVLGVASFDLQGIQGALFQLLNFTVIAGGLFLLTGFLHYRTGTTELVGLGGAARTMPLLASFFLLLGLASMGLPGTSGFPAELLLVFSALDTHTGAGLAALFAMVVGAGYFLGLYRKAFFGPVRTIYVELALDLRGRELLVAILLALVVLALGLYPQAVLDFTQTAGQAWIFRLPSG
ncbi:MAG: NADH-quinone oxidoreductase subunit M [Chromatiaceae bacterium]|nr:NADH-quinone oxidoreductase subunit M [Chromatiaceae bacterium]